MFDQDKSEDERPESTTGAADATTSESDVAVASSTADDTVTDAAATDDTEYVAIRPPWYRVGRGLVLVGIFLLFGLFIINGVRNWFDEQLDPPGEPDEAVSVIVPDGATTANIGRLLQDEDIVPNSTFFRYYAEWKDQGNFQAGEYQMFTNSSAQQAIDILNLGPKPQTFQRFTVREGLWISEMLPDIARQLDGVTEAQLQEVLRAGQILPRYRPEGEGSWEGLLFPDTYEISADADALEVLLKMSDEFTSVSGELSYGNANTPLELSAYEVLIVASLIEAETRVADERPLVASVIYNRLREGEPLGIDATCIYGSGDRKIQLTNEFMSSGTPYDCRERIGLPPTPINSPGRASMEAAIAPAETTHLFYVLTDPLGRHSFVDTIEEFSVEKKKCEDLGLC